jgi:hypothetical protein
MFRLTEIAAGSLAIGDRFGAAVSGTGDCDADGIPDCIVGAPLRDPNGFSSGFAQFYSLRPKGVQFYGAGTPGCLGPEFLTTNRVPKVGDAGFGYRCNKAPANSLGLLLASDSQDLAGSDPFAIGVALHVDFFLATEAWGFDIVSDAAGFGAATTPIANVPALVGADYYAQALWAWNSCVLPPFGLSTSSAVKLIIQP